MLISVLAAGSRGDVQAPAALAQGLAARGYKVRLYASDGHAHLFAGRGFDYKTIGLDIRRELESEGGRHLIGRTNPITVWRWFSDLARRYAHDVAPRVLEDVACSDLVVGTGLMDPVALLAARRWGIPCIHAWMQPCLAGKEFLSPYVPFAFDMPRWITSALNATAEQIGWLIMRSILRSAHDLVGVPAPGLRPPLRHAVRCGDMLLQAYSEAVLPRNSDWPPNVKVTGYWFLDRPRAWRPPDTLLRFIDAGPPPIYVGFGSMIIKNPRAALQVILTAIKKLECRAVISSGWSGMPLDDLPDNVLAISDAPHDWLFPRMTLVVHHGGAGTTGSALRAGLPSVVVPFMTDQFFWAKRLRERGVAPRAIPHKNLDAIRLATAINLALSDRLMRKRAAEIGAFVRAESGVQRAIAAIEHSLSHRSTTGRPRLQC